MSAFTTHATTNPEKNVVPLLGTISESLEKLKSENIDLYTQLKQLPGISYDKKSVKITSIDNGPLQLVTKISKGDQCIRIGSKSIVSSTNYYINLFFDETIPYFDPYSVESIA